MIVFMPLSFNRDSKFHQGYYKASLYTLNFQQLIIINIFILVYIII
ncbi:Uncharacterised protein [Klebsiella oxytoca]|nr:Uncharacterised protein [Klebsiella oxytoca]SAQ52811.1 Uncharacterised protein [Klebsiella oxytoca]SAU46471.1 Uncharacterised protein [Klebsiella pneumoniae]VTM91404.1 Uncharacterised protein [Raoultella ornithinolytica]